MGKRNCDLAVGEYYHIYNHAIDRSKLFIDDQDFGHFLLLLEYCNDTQPIRHLDNKIDWQSMSNPFKRRRATNERTELVTIEGYCLLGNHFHLLVKQEVEDGISQFMSRVCGGYSRKYNVRRGTQGTRFRGRFQVRHVDSEEYLYQLLAYVPANYLVHGIRDVSQYRTSLYRAFDSEDFITASPMIRAEFDCLESYMHYAIPKIQETRRMRGQDELFE